MGRRITTIEGAIEYLQERPQERQAHKNELAGKTCPARRKAYIRKQARNLATRGAFKARLLRAGLED